MGESRGSAAGGAKEEPQKEREKKMCSLTLVPCLKGGRGRSGDWGGGGVTLGMTCLYRVVNTRKLLVLRKSEWVVNVFSVELAVNLHHRFMYDQRWKRDKEGKKGSFLSSFMVWFKFCFHQGLVSETFDRKKNLKKRTKLTIMQEIHLWDIYNDITIMAEWSDHDLWVFFDFVFVFWFWMECAVKIISMDTKRPLSVAP